MDLCGLSDVKDYLTHKGDENNQILQTLISCVSMEIEDYLDRQATIPATAQTEFFDICPGQQFLQVRAFPITSVTGVWNDSTREFVSSSVIDAADYYLDKPRGRFVFDKTFLYSGPGVMKITYLGGMATDTDAFRTTYPAVSFACVQEVAYRFKHRGREAVVSSSMAGASITVIQKKQFTDAVFEILDPYRRVS